jgi:hypothetical protein
LTVKDQMNYEERHAAGSATTILKAESASMDGGNVTLTTMSFPEFSGL